jgi:hypothetical protein
VPYWDRPEWHRNSSDPLLFDRATAHTQSPFQNRTWLHCQAVLEMMALAGFWLYPAVTKPDFARVRLQARIVVIIAHDAGFRACFSIVRFT